MRTLQLGLRANRRQFALLVLVNAFVGGVVGMERSVVPALAEHVLHVEARTAILAFIAVFGVAKALTNYAAGALGDRYGRRPVLIAGWLVTLPVPLLLAWAPSWAWVLAANALLGVGQGLTWSTTVIMKIDLAGPKRRGLAMGLNEFAGYLAVAGSAYTTAWLAETYGLRPAPFAYGAALVVVGLGLSWALVRETHGHVALESRTLRETDARPSAREVFVRTTLRDRDLSSVTQAGLVNNLNDGMAWGLFPLVFEAAHVGLADIGLLAALYPASWGIGQLATGPLSDRVGRKWMIAAGMWTQALGIGVVVASRALGGLAAGSILLGLGTAMVYPTLLAAIGDVAAPSWRAASVGVYRLWRDLGYAVGAIVSGVAADLLGLAGAMWIVLALTALSGVVVAIRMRETLTPRARAAARSSAPPTSRAKPEALARAACSGP